MSKNDQLLLSVGSINEKALSCYDLFYRFVGIPPALVATFIGVESFFLQVRLKLDPERISPFIHLKSIYYYKTY
jgi:hypothetical protein